MKYVGRCHCGEVEYHVHAEEEVECLDCNCSICSKSGFLHLIVPKSQFTLIKGSEALQCYSFDTHEAKHLFCKNCGIKSYYIPRSNPDGYDVNVRCLHPQPKRITIKPFDGKNWEQSAAEIKHLSQDN